MKIKNSIVVLYVLAMTGILSAQSYKAMWVWSSGSVVGNVAQENILVNECLRIGVTDFFLYTPAVLKTSKIAALRAFIEKSSCNSIRVWGMDGWRGYFSDLCGPGEFYGFIQDVIDYNNSSKKEERFFGFHGDNEFHAYESECGGGDAFHYGQSDANLNTVSGGVWYASEKEDRSNLMIDFIQQTETAHSMCQNAGLEYSISVMPWVSATSYSHNAIGWQSTPLFATYKGVTKEVYKHLMDYLDEYVVMSYHTNIPGKVINMLEDELAYADGMLPENRPRVLSGTETHCDVGQYVSYCDTPGEDNKNHVESEIELHYNLLSEHESYSGIAIHDWKGWKELPAVSNNSVSPPGKACVSVGIFSDTKPHNFEVYPNPGMHTVKVTFDDLDGGIVRLYSLEGIEVFSKDVIGRSFLMDVTTLPLGVYVIAIEGKSGQSSQKFVKE